MAITRGLILLPLQLDMENPLMIIPSSQGKVMISPS